MIEENRQLGTHELIECEKEPVEVRDCRDITDNVRGMYGIYPDLIKENGRMPTCKPVGLANTQISID